MDLANIPSLQAIEAEKCRRSYYYFFSKAWKLLNRGRPLDDGWYIKCICDHLQAIAEDRIQHVIINVPPRFGKSMLCTNIFPCWLWLRESHKQIISASYKERLAIRDSMRSRKLMNTQWYKGLRRELYGSDEWDWELDANEKGRYNNTHGGWRISTSVGGSITGDGGDIIICDDTLHASQANSEADLLNLEEWWHESISTRMNDPLTGHWIVIQQRLHEQDQTGLILKEIEETGEKWDHICIPMRYEQDHEFPMKSSIGWSDPREEGELLSPTRFPEEVLIPIEKKLQSFGVAGQHAQRPVPKGGGIIRKEWWRPIGKKELLHGYTSLMTLQSWDTSYGEDALKKNKVAETACTTWCLIHPNDNENDKYLVLLDCWHGVPEFHEMRSKAIMMADTWEPDVILIERQASGISLIQELRRSGVFVYDFLPRRWGDKPSRVWSVQPIFQQGRVKYADWRYNCNDALNAMTQFPRGRRKDIVDTISQALLHFRDNLQIELAGDPLPEIEEEEWGKEFPAKALYGDIDDD